MKNIKIEDFYVTWANELSKRMPQRKEFMEDKDIAEEKKTEENINYILEIGLNTVQTALGLDQLFGDW